MRLRLVIGIVGMLGMIVCACQKSKSRTSTPDEETDTHESADESVVRQTPEPAAHESADESAARQTPEPAAPVSCSARNIPTYDLLIKDLSALRCDSCHNETFAWNGIVLTQYDAWKTYTKQIRNRIFYNLLTKPLEPGEQELFLSWIDQGLPRTDADCGNLK